jgi:hypothetical protein
MYPNLGNTSAATGQFEYFISQVKDDIDIGVLSSTSGQELMDSVSGIIYSLSNQVRCAVIIWNEYKDRIVLYAKNIKYV